MKKTANTLAILFASIALSGHAQTSKDLMPVVVSPAPDVAGLIKYAEVPVNTYNGTASFSVPVYELKEGDINLPITVNYSSNGLKVEEEATSVGLGWSLNANGVIQHISNQNNNYGPQKIVATNGDNGNLDYNFKLNSVQRGCVFQTESGTEVNLYQAGSQIQMGYDYALYLYNFPGHSGKSIRDRDGNMVEMGRENIILEAFANDSGFKATTPDGTQYFFMVRGSSITNYPGNPCSSSGNVSSISYTYYLSRIVTPTQQEVLFSYTSNETRSLPDLSQSYTKDNVSFTINKMFTTNVTTTTEYYLSEINTDNTRIKFTYSPRVDVYNSKKLDKIEVFRQGTSVSLRAVQFNYDYFVGNSATYGDFTTSTTLGGCGVLNQASNEDVKSKRLKLVSVRFSDQIATLNSNSPKYLFDYNTGDLPYKTSMAQDLWGYFNGQNNSTLLPNVNMLGYYDADVPTYFRQNPEGANRMSNVNFMRRGVLSKITSPTGGYTQISYDVNTFAAPSGSSDQYGIVEAFAQDYNSTADVIKEFSIISANETQELSVRLMCGSSNGPCDNNITPGECPGYYTNAVGQTAHPNDLRLYALIEKKTGSTWTVVNEYSRITPDVVNFAATQYVCGLDTNVTLDPGTYRLRVNYPDNKTGYLGGPWCQMVIRYTGLLPGSGYPNMGGGLRISSLADYNSATEQYNKKNYSYSDGLLITKPVIAAKSSFADLVAASNGSFTAGPDCPDGALLGDGPAGCPDYDIQTLSLRSDSMQPYSYNASGALVGYTEVTISYGTNTIGTPESYNGTEKFTFKNQVDAIFNYGAVLVGVPAARRMDNGLLIEKTTNRVSGSGTSSAVLSTVSKEVYEYQVSGFRDYWAFKQQFLRAAKCGGAPQTVPIYALAYNFVHFYPVKVGKMLLKKKTVTDYDSATASVIASVATDYLYNSKNQLQGESFTASDGSVVLKKTYYPTDVLAQGIQTVQMQELIALNRIDIPVRSETYRNSVKLAEQQTRFLKDATTGNLLLPKEIHALKGNAAIDVATATNRKVTFVKYDMDASGNGNGNILEALQENGTSVTYIWGYNKSVPIAKIENASYASIPAALVTNAQNASNGTDETALITALDALRTALPDAMVTTFTYRPLIGISTMTDPKGYRMTYQYDTLGRLSAVRDMNNYLVSENFYYYKP